MVCTVIIKVVGVCPKPVSIPLHGGNIVIILGAVRGCIFKSGCKYTITLRRNIVNIGDPVADIVAVIDAVPSIDIAKRMADAFEVSLEFLVGASENRLTKRC